MIATMSIKAVETREELEEVLLTDDKTDVITYKNEMYVLINFLEKRLARLALSSALVSSMTNIPNRRKFTLLSSEFISFQLIPNKIDPRRYVMEVV